jgi:hypothetical protein
MVVLFTILVILVAMFLYLYLQGPKKPKKTRLIRKTKKVRRNHLLRAYRVFTSIPILKDSFEQERSRIRFICPADDTTVNLQTTRIMLRAVVISLVSVLLLIYAANGDFVFLLMGLTVIYLIFELVNNHGYSNIETVLLGQFSSFIDGVRENYNNTGCVDDSVGMLLDTLPFEMGIHAEKIFEILTSTRVIEAATEYADISPSKYFTTFVEIASTTKEYGDKILPTGESMFLRNLNFLKEEVNNELLRRQTNAASFAGIAGIAIMPVFFIKPISIYWITNVPDVASYYNGAYGTVTMVLVFVISIICYRAIEYLKDNGKSAQVREDGISRRIANIPGIRRLVTGLVSRNYSTAVREEEMLRFTGDHLGINAFYVRRYLTGIIAGLAMFAVLGASVVRERYQVYYNFNQDFQTSIIPSLDYQDLMEETARTFVKKYGYTYSKDVDTNLREELVQKITTESEIHSSRYAELVADAVILHSQEIEGLYFKWYYLFAIYFATWIGYMSPKWVLLFKQSSVRMDMEDEVSQFQTIILMLMHVDGVSVNMILDWMERFAFCFKNSITECIYSMPHKGKNALRDLRDAETFPSFQLLVNSLISIDDVGVEKAFSGIEIDRGYYKDKRKEDNMIMTERKSNIATLLCFLPLLFILFSYFIFPVAQYALKQMEMFSIF